MNDQPDQVGAKSFVLKIQRMSRRPGTVSLSDVRMNKPLGVISKKDQTVTFLQRVIGIPFEGKTKLLIAPNQIALCLHSYKRNYDLGVKSYRKFEAIVQEGGKISGKKVKPVYDFIEHMEAAVVALYRAIETFANLSIPEDFEYKKNKSAGVTETYSKQGIERRISTSEKISEILPVILNLPSPKSETFWKGFLDFEELRNEIVHPKSGNFEKMIGKFFETDFSDLLGDAVELISYFVSRRPDDRLFPLGFGLSRVPLIATEDIEKRFETYREET